eukprot:GEZU01023778.1.p1 GENE.GEZU01023778.1~~GEZU01023778.1.p1  ORF type:complete len:437 (+),score=140.11 GEZU01023778.1:143-1453(+)
MSNIYHFHVLNTKTTLPLNLKSNPQLAKLIADSQFIPARERVEAAVEKFQAGKIALEEVESAITYYLSIIRGLYDYEGSGITPDEYLPGHSPIEKLRYGVYYFWTSAMSTNPELALNDAMYELVSILWNLTSCYMKEAIKILSGVKDTNKDELEKKAYQLFLKIAGVFEFMSDRMDEITTNANVVDRVPFEVRKESLEAMMKTAALAHSQEMAISRLVGKENKEELLTKLCTDTSRKFHQAMLRAITANSEDERCRAWIMYLGIKSKLYEAYAYSHYGVYCNKSDKNGNAISCCKKSIALFDAMAKDISTYEKLMTSSNMVQIHKIEYKKNTLPQIVKEAKAIPTANLAKFQKENAMIYHDSEPSEPPALPSLAEGQSVGKPVEFVMPNKDSVWRPSTYGLLADITKRRDYVPPPPQASPAPQQTKEDKKKDCIIS